MANGEQSRFLKAPGLDEIRGRMFGMWLVSALSQGSGQLLQLVATMILARILLPADFGLISMALVFVGVADIFRDAGLSTATVRAIDLQDKNANAMFFLNALLGIGMAVLVFLAGPLLSHVYDDPRVADIVAVLCVTFIINGLSAQHQALLRRRLQFKLLAKINVSVVFISQCVGVWLAFDGMGYWALVVTIIVSASLRLVFVVMANPWIPGKPTFDQVTRKMVSFGLYLAAFGLIGYVANNAHNLIIGATYGSDAVAFYNRAFMLLVMILGYASGPFATIAPATLSRMHNSASDFRAGYLELLSYNLILGVPVCVICILGASEIIAIVLGAQWTVSAEIFWLLSVSLIPRIIASSSGWIYQSSGNTRGMMLWGIGGWSFILCLLLLAAPSGIEAVATAYSVAMFLTVYPCMAIAFRRTTVTFRDVLIACRSPLGAGLIAFGLSWLGFSYVEGIVPIVRLGLLALVSSAIYILALVVVFSERELLSSMLQQVLGRRAGG